MLSSISEREPATDRLNEHGKGSANVVTSQGAVERRSRGEVASRDSTSLGQGERAFPGIEASGVDVVPAGQLWERPFPGSSRLTIAGTEGAEPSSMSKCRMSIVYHNGDWRVGTWKGSWRTAAVFLP